MLTTITRCSIRARARISIPTPTPTLLSTTPSQSSTLRHITNTSRLRANVLPPKSRSKPFPSSSSQTSSSSSLPIKPPTPSTTTQTSLEKTRSERVQHLALNLLTTGRSELYTNTASRPFVAAAISIFAASCAGIGAIYSTHLWDREETKRRGLPWFVASGYQAAMISWGFMAAYVLSRTFGLVKSMRLVKSGVDTVANSVAATGSAVGSARARGASERVMLEILVRRPVPFLRPERILSDPDTLVVNRAKLYGASLGEDDMIVAAEGDGFVTKAMRTLFYQPFHQTRKAFGGVSLVAVNVGKEGERRHLIIDAEGSFGNGGKDLLDLSRDEM